ncbi:hypothetical protein ILUMI_06128 [Ignelater luminosus]|uniref:Uncharacterized protein n=1 Tax=Ignelater luminosus TaxID=2038154 RepID=A0A8K0GHI1_IGNLU|nr:hypothetical protein ILUMI_06128 [Ignelater luminosus]
MESKVLNPILSKGDINLETAEQICRSSEATKRQAKDLQGEKVDVIRSEQKYMRDTRGYGKNINREREKTKDKYDCLKCGRQHSRGKCFAFGKRTPNVMLGNLQLQDEEFGKQNVGNYLRRISSKTFQQECFVKLETCEDCNHNSDKHIIITF